MIPMRSKESVWRAGSEERPLEGGLKGRLTDRVKEEKRGQRDSHSVRGQAFPCCPSVEGFPCP